MCAEVGEPERGVAAVARFEEESMLGRGDALLGVRDGARLWLGVALPPPVQDERYERNPPDEASWACSGGARLAAVVDIEDILEASSSSALVNMDELLFFLGKGGSTFPGNSCRNFLCILTKSPNRLATWISGLSFCFTLSRKLAC